MLLISANDFDKITTNIQYWLRYYGTPHIRVNKSDKLSVTTIKIDQKRVDAKLSVEGKYDKTEISLNQVKSYWYRRGGINIKQPEIDYKLYKNGDFLTTIHNRLDSEFHTVNRFINKYVDEKRAINSIYDNDIDKFTVLRKAAELGLSIPPTLITTSKASLQEFAEIHSYLITKALWNGFSLEFSGLEFGWPTLEFDFNELKNSIPSEFPISLFQANIHKKYELRIFFFNNCFYPSCIFSQRDRQTRVDFRNYNYSKANRVNTFVLPEVIKEKLRKLMVEMQLASGSIDMIVTEQGEYFFLEVNPVGQFYQVSKPCNYYLEKIVAKYFSHE